MKKNKLKELYRIATELDSDLYLLEFNDDVKFNPNDSFEGKSLMDSFLDNRVWKPLVDNLKVEFNKDKRSYFSNLTDNDWSRIFLSWQSLLKSSIEPALIKDYIVREDELNIYGYNRFSIIETLNKFFYEVMLEPLEGGGKWMTKERAIEHTREAIKYQIKSMDNDILWHRYNSL